MLLKNKVEIEKWLNQYNVKKYELIEDEEYGYVVNVNEHVALYDRNLKSIDVKFNIVNGNFYCNHNKLKNLEGCPKIVNGDFICYNNELTSLKEFPKKIKNKVYLNNNNLTINALKYIIIEIIKNKVFINSKIISLKSNPELGELQNIKDLNKIKKIITIYQEKADLMKILEVTDLSVKSTGLVMTVESLDLLKNKESESVGLIMAKKITDKSIVVGKINKI